MIPNAAACLFIVLVLAKILVIGLSGVSSPWLFAQDALVAVAFAFVDFALRGRRWIWIPYAIAVLWTAINVPVARVLGSWLTWPMLLATGGPLADSIRYYLTPANLVPLTLVIVAGVALPVLMRRRKIAAIIAAAVLVVAAGVTTKGKATDGFERNALTTILAGRRFEIRQGLIAPNNQRRLSSCLEGSQPGCPKKNESRSHFRNESRSYLNVVVVILESTAAQYLGMYGAVEDPMPNLTKIAAHSIVFDAAYAVYPESVKGLYATLCGRPPRIGLPLEASLSDECSPLPKLFGAAGYRTGLFHAGRFGYLGMDALVKQSGFDTAEDAGAIGGVVRSSFGVDEASTVARTLSWIHDDNDRRPFFAIYMPAAGHHPYASAIAGPFAGETEFDRYRNAIHETDASLAALVKGLPANTALMVFGDHGEAFGQHGGNTGHTLAIWDENVRIPMLISIPGVTTDEMRVAAPASVLDVAPTLLDVIGAATPEVAAGSLLSATTRLSPFFADYSRELFGVRDACWKLQYDRTEDRTALFNLCEDPGETSDLAGRFQAVHDELVKRIEQFFAVRIRPRRVAA